MSISDRLDDIQARADAATRGPWEMRGDEDYGFEVHGQREPSSLKGLWKPTEVCAPSEERNAEFIAHARADVPRLVATLRAVLDVCDGLEEAHRANPEQTYEYGLDEAANQVRNAAEARDMARRIGRNIAVYEAIARHLEARNAGA